MIDDESEPGSWAKALKYKFPSDHESESTKLGLILKIQEEVRKIKQIDYQVDLPDDVNDSLNIIQNCLNDYINFDLMEPTLKEYFK